MHTAVLLVSIFAAASGDPTTAEFKQPDVRVRVKVLVNEYAYEVMNLGTSPIVGFEISHVRTYNRQAPKGWKIEHREGQIRAWTDDPLIGIQPGFGGQFRARVASEGATLGAGTAVVRFADGRETILPGVWRSRPAPRRTSFLLSAFLVAIMLVHSLWLSRRSAHRRMGNLRPG